MRDPLCDVNTIMACLHRRHGQDKTVLSRPCRRCEQAIKRRVDFYRLNLPVSRGLELNPQWCSLVDGLVWLVSQPQVISRQFKPWLNSFVSCGEIVVPLNVRHAQLTRSKRSWGWSCYFLDLPCDLPHVASPVDRSLYEEVDARCINRLVIQHCPTIYHFVGKILTHHRRASSNKSSITIELRIVDTSPTVFFTCDHKTRQDKTTRGHGRRHYRASKSSSPMSILRWQYSFYSTKNSDRSPVPVRLALQSNLTGWLDQNLSKRFLNTSMESTFTT